MESDWLSYAEAAERLNTTPEAVRQKAIRGRWQRTIGNDKKARIRLPDGWADAVRTGNDRRTGGVCELRSDGRPTPLFSRRADALREHNATLKADIEKLEALLATERERADKAITGFEALLRTESERADRAITAFESLAQRLEAMAAAKRPWWHRMLWNG
jgi:hypothetical protein